MNEMPDEAALAVPWRERKRRETAQRIMDAGIRLIVANGYEAATLDAIAAEAGISRRTFFSYFESKDDILFSMQSGLGEALAAIVREAPEGQRPLDAVRHALVKSCGGDAGEDMIVLDRIMRSRQSIQVRKQAAYLQHEKTLYAALRERWPEPEREMGLRLVAMLSIGALRLALDAWSLEGGARPIPELLGETFDALEAEV